MLSAPDHCSASQAPVRCTEFASEAMCPASEAVSEAPRKRARASPESFSEVTSSGHAGGQSFSHDQQIACACPSDLFFSEIAHLRDELLAQNGAPPADTPEAFAFSILETRTPTKEDVLMLAQMLPLSLSPRDERAKSFSSGASVHGGAVNIRKTCGAFPFSSLAVTSYVRATAPECAFSTFSLLFEDAAKPHKDLQNHSCENYVFPLSNFSGGELWVEGHGSEQRNLEGKDVTGGPLHWRDKNFVHFRADKHIHFVLPWEGSRVVLVAFCIRFFSELGPEKLATLVSLGFRLPPLPEVQGPSAVLPAAEAAIPVVMSRPAPAPTEPLASTAPIKKVLHFILVQGPVGVMRHRLNVFKLWQRWAVELEPEERKFREALHPDVKAVLGNKRILLMKKIASSLKWPDVTLWDDLASGFKLTGSQPRT